jgi:hypothetical protein
MPNTNCTEFSRLLEEAVESRWPVDTPALRGHAAACTGCKAAWLDAVLLDGALAQWKTKKMLSPVDLTDAVLFRQTAAADDRPAVINLDAVRLSTVRLPPAVPLARRPLARRPRWFSRRTAAAAAMVLATVVCVPLLSGRLGLRQGNLDLASVPLPSMPHPIVLTNSLTKHTAPLSAAAGPVRPKQAPAKPVADAPVETVVQDTVVEDAQSAYLDLAREAAQAVAGASVLVPRPGPAAALAPAVDENDRWVDDVGREFEPVSKNLSQAFQFLFEAVPAEKAPAT